MPLTSSPDNSGSRVRQWLTLVACVCLILLVWLVILPAAGRTELLSRRIQFLESRGIDPSARFYTDQEAGWRNAKTMELKVQQLPAAFWRIGDPGN
jgi:hypothetical protein